MHLSVVSLLTFGLLPTLTFGAPAPTPQQPPTITDDQRSAMASAVNLWAQKTSAVSFFLSSASSWTGQALVDQAQVALNAENDERAPKQVLDAIFLPGNPDVVAADDVLNKQGTFEMVVSGLENFVEQGATFTPQDIEDHVNAINEIRCGQVLKNIKKYFVAAAEVLQTGIIVLPNFPNNCPADTNAAE